MTPALCLAAAAAWAADRTESVQRLAEIVLPPLERLHAAAVGGLLRVAGVVDARAEGPVVRNGGFAYMIDPGCLGLPLIALLLIGIAVSDASRRRRLWGGLLGLAVLVAMNLGRLVHLFHLGVSTPALFPLAHDVVWPAVMAAATVLFWIGFRRRVPWGVALLAFVAVPAFAGPPGDLPPTYEEALASDEALQRLMKTLPRQQYYYILEGDIRLTESEIRPYLSGLRAPEARTDRSSELIVNLVNGAPDYWVDRSRRELTYAVDAASFTPEEYARVVQHMRTATRDWESACSECGIRFVHKERHDAAPSPDDVVFIVRKQALPRPLIALAFFPSQPARRRYIDLDQRFFSTAFDPDGVLRHELGHALGYRHEQLGVGNRCYQAEEGRWVALTPYDSKSVMHYPCEGVTQQGHERFVISETDVIGHRALYGDAAHAGRGSSVGLAEARAEPRRSGVVVVRLEGGEISSNAARVTGVLVDRGLVRLKAVPVKGKAQTPCALYHAPGRLPGACSRATAELAARLNDVPEGKAVSTSTGRSLKVPQVTFEPYDYGIVLDPKVARQKRQLDQIKKHWGTKVRRVDKDRKGVHAFHLVGYRTEVRVDNQETAKELRAQFETEFTNVRVSFEPDVPYDKVLYGAKQMPTAHWRACSNGVPPAGDQGDYLRLFPTSTAPIPACARDATRPRRPTLVIADAPIAKHPDIAPALGDAATAPTDGHCKAIDFTPGFHGTMLAGLVAAQDNSFGFVGVSPHVQIEPYDWVHGSVATLAQEIRQDRRAPTALFLFASRWDLRDRLTPNVDYNGLQLTSVKLREGPIVAERIRDMRPLWIAAAGQPDPGKSPREYPVMIRKDTVFGPMNLGDFSNVVIVTACVDCTDEGARLMADANFSTDGLVHVAAPGMAMPGLATNDAYVYADVGGTSQAAALVAGVASAMLGCYPGYYTSADLVKTRLQVTSRPVLWEEDEERVAAGIVDPGLALQDPSKMWLQPDAGADAAPKHWCHEALELRYGAEQLTPAGWRVNTEDVYRIVRYRGRGADDANPEWVVFAKWGFDRGRNHLAEVRRLGPGVLPKGAIIRLKDDRVLRLENIEDLVLASPIGSGPCSGS